MKPLKKLSLKKEVIAKLQNDEMNFAKGGSGATSTVCANPGTESLGYCFTRGDCDIPTIGHNDGKGCLSKTDWGWCWCYGRK